MAILRPVLQPILRPILGSVLDSSLKKSFDPSSYSLIDFWPAKSNTVLVGGGTPAGAFDYVATLQNRSTLAGKASNATQGTSASQPLYLPHTPEENYLYLPGIAGNYASVPDSSNLFTAGDLTIIANLTMPSWSPATIEHIYTREDELSLRFDTGGNLLFAHYELGFQSVTTTAPVGFSDGQSGWVKVQRVGNVVTFWKSTDGNIWTQIGSDRTISGTPQEAAGENTYNIGIYGGGTIPLRGYVHQLQVFASSNGTDKRLDVDFSAAPHIASSFVCATGQTVTINSSGTNPATIVGQAMLRFDGFDDWLGVTLVDSITGYKLFAVATLNKWSLAQRIIAMSAAVGSDDGADTATPWMCSFTTDETVMQVASSFKGPQSPSGRVLYEAEASSSGGATRINGASEATYSGSYSLEMDLMNIGGRIGSGGAALDLERLILLPTNISSDTVAKTRAYLNKVHNLGLTL